MSILFSIMGTLLVCSIFFYFYIIKIRTKIVNYSNLLCETIEKLIDGTDAVNFQSISDDTLASKIQEKLFKLNDILHLQANQNRESHEKLQSLISDISHQVKTPLSVIHMYSDVLKDRNVDDKKRSEISEAIGRQVEKLEFLINALLKMSRLETGIIKINPIPYPITKTIEDAMSGVRQTAMQKDITVTFSCDPSLMVMHDPKWTAEAIYNLLDNAVKYTSRGGLIDIQVQKWEVRTRIQIIDNGKGINPQSVSLIFTRFYREPDAYGVEGVGLGLSLAKEICNIQGGSIKVDSAPDKGSVFSVFLPNS